MNGINLEAVETFFQFLAPNDPLFTVAFLDAAGKGACPGYGTFTGSVPEILNLAETLSTQESATLHTTLNQTNDSGRRKADIRACRCLVIDLDSPRSVEEIQALIDESRPGLVVCSSPGKYHVYWKIAETIPLVNWQIYQLTLAYHFNADPHLAELSKTLRVPGVPRLTKDGSEFVPAIVYRDENHATLTESELLQVFPWLASEQDAAKAWKTELKASQAKASKEIDSHVNGNGNGKVHMLEGASRNETLFKRAFHEAAKFSPDIQPWEEAKLLEYITQANESFDEPLEESELETIVKSAYERGIAVRADAEKAFNSKALESSDFRYDYSDEFLRSNPYSNLALVSRIVQRFNHKLLRVGKNVFGFHSFDHVWRTQEVESAAELGMFYKACVNDMLGEKGFRDTYCMTNANDFSHKKYQQATDRLLNLSNYRNVVSAVKSHHAIARKDITDFDAVEHMLHTQSGLLNMLTEEVRPAEPADLVLAKSPLHFNPEATCPEFQEFLYSVFEENESPAEMVTFMQRLFGYSLSGSIREQKLFLHYGAGCNGKSKILSVFRYLLGDYYSIVDPDEFSSGRFGAMTRFERLGVKMEGKRCIVIDDMETESVWNETFVKNCTSNEIRARAEREKSRVTVNRAKMHLGLNTIPKPQTEVHGFIRRLCIINYAKQFENDMAESKRIDAMIYREKEGILAWAVQGYRHWVSANGLQYPEEIEVALGKYTEEHFILPRVIREAYAAQDGCVGIASADIVSEVTALVKMQPGGSKRAYGKNEILNCFRTVFRLESKQIWNPSTKIPSRGYAVVRKALIS